MKALRTITVLALVLLVAGVAGAQSTQFVPYGFTQHLNVAQMGMGGLTTTVSSNAHTVIYNPGMLTRQRFALEITVPVGLDQDLADLTSFVSDNSDKFANFEELSPEEQSQFMTDSQEFDNKWFGLNMGPFFGLSFKNFGVAAYGQFSGDLKMDQGVLVPALGLRGYSDVVGAVGFGKTFEVAGREIGFGIAGRGISRSMISPQRINAADAGNSSDLATTLTDELSDSKSGFGIDVGAIHTLELGEPGSGVNLDVAAVIQDLYGSIDGEYRVPNLKLGGMYHMPFAGNAFVRRWDVGVDVTDIFNRQGVHFFQRINMGTELTVLAGLISVRGGFHQGYPTFGAGVRLAIIKIDVAKFTQEMGTSPGQDPADYLMMQFSIG